MRLWSKDWGFIENINTKYSHASTVHVILFLLHVKYMLIYY